MLSIRARLTLWYSGVLFAVLVGEAFAVLSLHSRLELARLDEDLAASAHTVNGVLRNEFAERLAAAAAVHDMRCRPTRSRSRRSNGWSCRQ